MIAGAGVMPVPDAQLLLAMGRAHARIHVEHDASRRAATVHKVDPLARAGQVIARVDHRHRACALSCLKSRGRSIRNAQGVPRGDQPAPRRRSDRLRRRDADGAENGRRRVGQARPHPEHGSGLCAGARRSAAAAEVDVNVASLPLIYDRSARAAALSKWPGSRWTRTPHSNRCSLSSRR
jgi:hypothetical protein